MKTDLLVDLDENKSLDVQPESPYIKTLRKAKEALLQVFSASHTHGAAKYMWLQTIWPVIHSWQLLSLIVPTEGTMQEWQKYRGVTHSFYYLRLDGLAAELGQLSTFVFFVLAAINVTVLLLCAQVVLGVRQKTQPALSIAFHYCLTALDSLLYAGAVVASADSIKYSFLSNPSDKAAEYDGGHADRSPALAVFALVSLPALVAVKMTACMFAYESRYLKRKVTAMAMPCASVRINQALTETIVCVLYVFFGDQEKWYLVIVAVLFGRMALLHITQLPYYVLVNNIANCVPSVLCSWAALAYFLAIVLDNADVLFWLFLFVSPLLIVLSAALMSTVRTRIYQSDISQAANVIVVEIYLRQLYEAHESSTPSGKEELEARIHTVFNYATRQFRQAGLLFLWEAEFYLSYCKDSSRALGKISKLSAATVTLEVYFHASKLLAKVEKVGSEELGYFRAQHTFEKAKRADKLLCASLMAFCGELLSFDGRMEKLEMQAKRVYYLSNKCVTRYKTLCDSSSVPREALETYSQLLQTVLNDPSSLSVIKHQRFREEKHLERDESLLSKKRGVIVLSFREKDFGTIVHANGFASGKLGNKVTDVVGSHIGKFLPGPIAKKHDAIGQRTITYGRDFTALPTLYRYFLSKSSHLLQVSSNCHLIIWKLDLYLVVDFQLQRGECAVLDSALTVLHCSEGFTARCGGLPTARADGLHISKVCADLHAPLVSLPREGKQEVTVPQTSARLLLERTEYSDYTVYSITTVKSEGESSFWDSGVAGQVEERLVGSVGAVLSKSQKKVEFHEGKTDAHTEAPQTRGDIRASASTISSSNVSPQVVKRTKSIGKLKSTAKVLKVAILASMMTMAAFAIGILLVILGLIERMKNMNNVTELTEQLFLAASIADSVRTITLVERLPGVDIGGIESQLQSDLSTFSSILNSLQGEIESWTDKAAQRYYSQPLVPTFTPQADDFQLQWRTMLDASLHLVAEASAFLAQESPNHSSHFLYVYRNALTETYRYLNRTNYSYIEGEQVQRTRSMSVVIYLLVVWILLVALVFCALLVVVKWKVDQCKLEVWEEFLACPLEVLQSIKQTAADRLSNIHGEETVADEMRRRKANTKPQFAKIWPGIALRLSVYVAVSAVVIYTLFFWQYGVLTDLLITMPHYTTMVIQRRAGSLGAFFWLRERFVQVHDADQQFAQLVSLHSPIISPEAEFANSTRTTRVISKVLFAKRKDYDILYVRRSASYDNFVFADACSKLTFTDCKVTTFAFGLRRAMDDYFRWLESLNANIQKTEWSDMAAAQRLARRVDEGLKYVQDFYEQDSEKLLNEFRSLFAGVTSVYCLFLVALALGCYIPYITKARRVILNLWTVLTLFSFDERRALDRS